MKLFLILPVFLFCSAVAFAQTATPRPTPPPPPPPRPIDGTARGSGQDTPPLTSFEEEMRAKHAIKLAEKDHKENLDRARQIGQLGKELQEALKGKSTLDRDSLKKIERLEKLTKKVRGEAGGEDEEVDIIDRPADISTAAAKVAEASEALSKNVQNTPRQVVSASVIGEANVLLELIKMLRAFDPRRQ
ncbi:MAG TPA: hypothetical protein VFR78_17010 [Pyrinomonadaceae bacterium]|nr:hypothetical protein [Pyrinomonadaceae bacterium]